MALGPTSHVYCAAGGGLRKEAAPNVDVGSTHTGEGGIRKESAKQSTETSLRLQGRPLLFIADLRRPLSRRGIREAFTGPRKRFGKAMLRERGPFVAMMLTPDAFCTRSFSEAQLESEVLAFEFACRVTEQSGTILHSVEEPLKRRIDAVVASTWRCGGTA